MSDQIVILSGPPCAGKSAVAEALCTRYDRMAHIDVDTLRHFIRAGRVRPWDPSPEAQRQITLAVRNACALAHNFIAEHFGVVIDDVVGPDTLRLYLEELSPYRVPVHFVVLLPSLEVLLERDRRRPTEWHAGGRVAELYHYFVEEGNFAGATFDTSDLTPEETADRVMTLAAQGRCLVCEPHGSAPTRPGEKPPPEFTR